jgi:hypothetical protein
MKRKITCPESGHLEEIEFEEDPVDGHILGLSSCTGLDSPDLVDCGLECVHRLNRRYGMKVEEGARRRRAPVTLEGADGAAAPPPGAPSPGAPEGQAESHGDPVSAGDAAPARPRRRK